MTFERSELQALAQRVEEMEEDVRQLRGEHDQWSEFTQSFVSEILARLKQMETDGVESAKLFGDRVAEFESKLAQFGRSVAEANKLGDQGTIANRQVQHLITRLVSDLLPAVDDHSHEPSLRIYRNQESIDSLPKCTICSKPRYQEQMKTCGNYGCIIKLLQSPETND